MMAKRPAPGRMASEDSKHRGWVSGMVPRPSQEVKTGMPVFSTKETSSFPASEYQAPLPAMTTGRGPDGSFRSVAGLIGITDGIG